LMTSRGETRYLHTKKVPLLDAEGVPRFLLGISEDITERKEAERQVALLNEGLRHRTTELEAANQELEAFSYSVSHDLRAPLRHLDGFTDLLIRHSAPQLDDKGRRYLDILSGSAKHMGRLIDDLLSFSRMNRAEMQQTHVPLEGLIADVRRSLEGQSPGRAIEWKLGPLPVVQGDPAMLRLVFVNLLANAVKYTGPRAPAVIEIGAQETEQEWVVFVRDNGVGFDMRYAHKLFGVFQRLHRADEFEGTGIGLANVRRIIHRHGGRAWAEGVLDQGATFFVSLPRHEALSEAREAA
jgi:light-regulated signal transduction histidine kinase (bacteriophytochrome)